jgi:hypothetical protein
MEPNRIKNRVQTPEVLEFEKNVIERKLQGSNFGRTWLKPIPRQPSHKF